MNTFNTNKTIGFVRLSNIEDTKLSNNYQVRLLDSYGVDEIFTDNTVCLNFKQSVSSKLEELGLMDKLITNSRLVIQVSERADILRRWLEHLSRQLQCYTLY